MEVLDCHSYLSERHPVRRAGTICYLLAPQPDSRGIDLDGFRHCCAQLDPARVVGGLLPVLGLPDPTLKTALADPFWKALLLTPVYHPPGEPEISLLNPAIDGVLELARDLPLMVECGVEGFSRPPALEAFLTRFPERDVVLTHGGQLNISGGHLAAAEALFAQFPHTHLETSGIYRQDFLEQQAAAMTPARILYGSGHPWMDERLELERVNILPFGSDALQDMRGGNARRLFRL
jgi:hypothetical protein